VPPAAELSDVKLTADRCDLIPNIFYIQQGNEDYLTKKNWGTYPQLYLNLKTLVYTGTSNIQIILANNGPLVFDVYNFYFLKKACLKNILQKSKFLTNICFII
jgi:hypothetical protein